MKNRACGPVYEAIKTGSGRRSRNEGVRVGTLALFQEGVELLATSLMLRPSHT